MLNICAFHSAQNSFEILYYVKREAHESNNFLHCHRRIDTDEKIFSQDEIRVYSS